MFTLEKKDIELRKVLWNPKDEGKLVKNHLYPSERPDGTKIVIQFVEDDRFIHDENDMVRWADGRELTAEEIEEFRWQ